MKKEFIDYSALVDDAMHLIVKKSLEIFAENDMGSDHHFFISFVTKYPGVSISKKLHNKYPYEMTIVLQYQFEDLVVTEEGFSVYLSFDNQQEKIVIPFAALTAFADPSVKFGLQFRHVDDGQIDNEYNLDSFSANNSYSSSKVQADPVVKAETKGNVISLDFKNKKLK
jgi:uncharacterized protein